MVGKCQNGWSEGLRLIKFLLARKIILATSLAVGEWGAKDSLKGKQHPHIAAQVPHFKSEYFVFSLSSVNAVVSQEIEKNPNCIKAVPSDLPIGLYRARRKLPPAFLFSL